MSEAEWQELVIEFAHLKKWHVVHFRPGRTEHGWRTPVAGDGQGFPDLILVRDRLVVAELKSERGRIGPGQATWWGWLADAGVEAYVWRPSDWDLVQEVLG